MMMIKHMNSMTGWKALLTGVLALAVAGTASAQQGVSVSPSTSTVGPQTGDWEFTLGGSGSSSHDFRSGGFAADGSLGYYLTENWEIALRQGIGYSDFGDSVWTGETRGALDYHFDLHRLRPFLGVNFGYLYGDQVEETFTAGLETGAKYYVQARTFIFGRVEWAWLFEDAGDADESFDDGRFVYSLGIGFNF